MSNCDHNCSSCASKGGCADAPKTKSPHELSRIKRVIAVVSGKGGVGKSAVTSLLAVAMAKKGYKCALLDADITGPSIPKAFGVKGDVKGDSLGIYPADTKGGIKLISSNLFLEHDTDPVIWRGPVISGMVEQFWTDVIWGDVDYMFIDCPPGTGDVPLTIFQSIKVDGIVVVATPQDLVSMIVEKAVNMASMMKIPVLGIVENMSYVVCPHCGEKTYIFGKGAAANVAKKHGLPLLAEIPIDTKLAAAADGGKIEDVTVDYVDAAVDIIESGLPAGSEACGA